MLRLLGARGRAEHATQDPARFLPSVPSAVATVNPPSFGGTHGSCTLSHYFAGIGAAYDAVANQFPSAAIWEALEDFSRSEFMYRTARMRFLARRKAL
jgi:hypothetical protein